MMRYSVALFALLCLGSSPANSEQDYVQLLAQRHAQVFPAARERLVYYAPDNLKEKLKTTELVIGSSRPLSRCGTQSMYSTFRNGHPVIVYCPTGYRVIHDFGQGYAYISVYALSLGAKTEDVTLDFLARYQRYLSSAALSIFSRENGTPYPKLCEPLLFAYLFAMNLNPEKCMTQLDQYKAAIDWMYNDERNGAITEAKLLKVLENIPNAKLDYSKEMRNKFISNMLGQVQAGQWFGQLFHEFFHIMNGDLEKPPISAEESNEREIKADEFALKMIIFDDPDASALRIPAFNITQAFAGASIDSDKFEPRLKLSYLETIKIIQTYKDKLPANYYTKIMADFEVRCKDNRCLPKN